MSDIFELYLKLYNFFLNLNIGRIRRGYNNTIFLFYNYKIKIFYDKINIVYVTKDSIYNIYCRRETCLLL